MNDADKIATEWDYSTLPANVRLAQECFIESKKVFDRYRSEQDPGLVLGNRVRVYNFTVLNVEPSGRIEIGKRVIVSYNVTIADSDFHPTDPEARKRDAIANSPSGDHTLRPQIEAKPIEIGDDVWIGIGAIVLKGVKIGAGARIGAGAVITRDVPAHSYYVGNPARAVKDDQPR